ncbi:hypothetical protein QTO34_001909 [Cnephaeus nilssonii]|uniref:Secretogranin-1 n=1 Tax=Cnephaeus nilssonii TaxID=3371016 RepID=A0AA40HTX0_CNENI|nr:hypothetical protein QTO34_001909 [Eptesicus nilssonii]
MQPAVLLVLLGATMVAVVSSMPVDNRNHNEEMVTRCIIEVLSNALAKSNAPPISPECLQVLKRSGKEVKDEEKSENEKTRFEVRLLRDQADASEAHRPSSREDTGDPEEADTQGLSVANTEGGGHSREGAGEPKGASIPLRVKSPKKRRHTILRRARERTARKRKERNTRKGSMGKVAVKRNTWKSQARHKVPFLTKETRPQLRKKRR